MKLIGIPDSWLDLINSLVPDIFDLVASTWQNMPVLASDAREDPTTEELCRRLRQNRSAAELPFRIDIQLVELNPAADADQGRMDIVFSPLIPSEEIYFCLECKRLNAVSRGHKRSYAPEYVIHGMLRFICGQYASRVQHGGMLAYVLDDNIDNAIANVSIAVRRHHEILEMQPPGTMLPSTIMPRDETVKETHHMRNLTYKAFCIHHIFAPGTTR